MLDRFHKISEIIASLAIVGSLIFVGIQVSQNTNALKSNAAQTSAASWQEITLTMATDSALIEAWMEKAPNANATANDVRMFNFVAAFLKSVELNYHMWMDGNLDDDMWNSIRAALVNSCLPNHFTRNTGRSREVSGTQLLLGLCSEK
jgi:hypothetical protein